MSKTATKATAPATKYKPVHIEPARLTRGEALSLSEISFDEARTILEEKLIHCEDIAHVLSLGLTAGKNIILSGPGGHAKSLAVQHLLQRSNKWEETFVLSGGDGLDEAALLGGPNMKALRHNLEFHLERSFIHSPIFLFEEMFDSPASTLLALKDIMTSGEVRKGAQRVATSTQCIIVCTNKEPEEIAELGEQYAALIDRFPLRLRVVWPSYGKGDYLDMFNKRPDAHLDGLAPVLAETIARANDAGYTISPRMAMHLFDLTQTEAKINGRRVVEKLDLLVMKHLGDMQNVGEEVLAGIEDAALQERTRVMVEEALAQAGEDYLAAGGSTFEGTSTEDPLSFLRMASRIEPIIETLENLHIPEGASEHFEETVSNYVKKLERTREKAHRKAAQYA